MKVVILRYWLPFSGPIWSRLSAMVRMHIALPRVMQSDGLSEGKTLMSIFLSALALSVDAAQYVHLWVKFPHNVSLAAPERVDFDALDIVSKLLHNLFVFLILNIRIITMQRYEEIPETPNVSGISFLSDRLPA